LNRQSSSDIGSDILQYDNEFWRFSLTVYGRPGVAEECLALQQAIGADVNVLLFCGWTGARSIALRRDDIEKIMGHVGAWQDQVVGPLRNVRQDMKRLKVESFRARIKTIELEAEQIEQAILFAYSQRFQGGNKSARDAATGNIKRYIEIKSAQTTLTAPLLVEAALLERS
jgi:uncharacterized protein (TIGR02444 family)